MKHLLLLGFVLSLVCYVGGFKEYFVIMHIYLVGFLLLEEIKK
jgi:hypothetical protein